MPHAYAYRVGNVYSISLPGDFVFSTLPERFYMHWFLLFTAITFEAFASAALKMTQGFTKPLPSICVGIALLASLYCSSLALKTISVSIAYALWSGVGMLLVVAIAWLWFGQKIDLAAAIGLGFIALGILILFMFSKSLTY